MKFKSVLQSQKGVSLIEILVGMILLAIVCIATLSYFAYGLGGIGKQGNRRAAMERARERLEQLMAVAKNQLPSKDDGNIYWCNSGNPCASDGWVASIAPIAQTVSVNDLASQRMETTVRGVHDAAAGTSAGFYDAWEISAKVWFTSDTNTDDDFNRVYLKTLRAP